ncbi:MAG: hypothetical protein L3K15_08325 [Thermoplasmata archaeon]|nr:hypothetical protein [Thermoplasmata archaeon]
MPRPRMPSARERPRLQLERLVQQLERDHPEWNARRFEAELEVLAPVVYGGWKDDTPESESRLRQVQRWRSGFRSPGLPTVHLPFRYLWPVGERQRHALEPGFDPGRARPRASHRVFLQNVSDEIVREVRARLGGKDVSYEPALAPKSFAMVRWTGNPDVRAAAIASGPHVRLPFPFRVEFAVAKGTRRASLDGELVLDSDDGWVSFVSSDGQSKEIE